MDPAYKGETFLLLGFKLEFLQNAEYRGVKTFEISEVSGVGGESG